MLEQRTLTHISFAKFDCHQETTRSVNSLALNPTTRDILRSIQRLPPGVLAESDHLRFECLHRLYSILAIVLRDVFAILALGEEVEDLFQRRGSIW
jgi:hypothetical protein